MEKLIKQAATDLANSKRLVALTGAGISVESNIPPFRGKGGVWERFDPMEYAHIDAFMKNPKKVWDVLLREMKGIIDIAKPNRIAAIPKSFENVRAMITRLPSITYGMEVAYSGSSTK